MYSETSILQHMHYEPSKKCHITEVVGWPSVSYGDFPSESGQIKTEGYGVLRCHTTGYSMQF